MDSISPRIASNFPLCAVSLVIEKESPFEGVSDRNMKERARILSLYDWISNQLIDNPHKARLMPYK